MDCTSGATPFALYDPIRIVCACVCVRERERERDIYRKRERISVWRAVAQQITVTYIVLSYNIRSIFDNMENVLPWKALKRYHITGIGLPDVSGELPSISFIYLSAWV